jgi:RimJ/RimL family protein N-acetyltransferase
MAEAAARALARVTAGPYTLRPWEPADVAWVYDACQDAEIQRFSRLPRPYRPADAIALLARSRAGRIDASAYLFAIANTDNDELLGSIELQRTGAEGAIGYWVTALARGQGVATTALTALTHWGFASLRVARVWLEIAVTNTASRRVAERAGFTPSERPGGGCPDGDALVAAVIYERRVAPAGAQYGLPAGSR